MKLIAFHNIKGGVGKTAAAVNIAQLAGAAGVPTLLWDLDAQAAATWYLAGGAGNPRVKAGKLIRGKTPLGRLITRTSLTNVDLLPSDVSFRNMDLQLERQGNDQLFSDLVAPLSEDYALVILDCPPSLSRLAEAVFRTADRIYVPLLPTWLSINSWEQLLTFTRDRKLNAKRLFPFLSMVDRRKALHRELLDAPPASLKRLLSGYIPYATEVERMGEKRLPVNVFAPRSPAALAYRLMWEQMRQQLKL